jgi:hypothetical protein
VNLLAFASRLFPLFILLAGFANACLTLPHYWYCYRSAATPNERMYFALRFAGSWSFVYAMSMMAILLVDSIYNFGLADCWPTLSFVIFDWDMSHYNSVCVDIVISLLLAIPLSITANLFGSEDEYSGQYVVPTRVAACEHIEDVMTRYRAVLASDPVTSLENFGTYPLIVRNRLIDEYKARLADIESRVRTVHQIWHKRCPIT